MASCRREHAWLRAVSDGYVLWIAMIAINGADDDMCQRGKFVSHAEGNMCLVGHRFVNPFDGNDYGRPGRVEDLQRQRAFLYDSRKHTRMKPVNDIASH